MCGRLICSALLCLMVGTFWAGAALGFSAGPDPDLVGWWKLDEATGGLACDSSGLGNDGVIYGSALWTTGQIDGALQFDGTDDYINCGNKPSFHIRDQITIAFWLKTAGFTRNWSTIISKGDTSWRMSRSAETGNSVHLGLNGTVATPYAWFDASKPVANDEWRHVAGVYDGTQGRIYIDGVLEASQAATGQLNDNDVDVLIGENAESTNRYLSGSLDDVRVYKRALTAAEIEVVMAGYAGPTAVEPNPQDGATDVPRDVIASWTAGPFAQTHDVYFGTTFDDVNTATTAAPRGVLASAGQTATTYDPPGLLPFGQTCCWRVDEVNAPPDSTVFQGPVWTFTVEPYSYPITPTGATASSSMTASSGPEKTIDGSGLDAQDRHSTTGSQMWMSKATPAPSWIKYEFDKPHRFDQMWVWNSNQSMEFAMGNGAKEVRIEVSMDDVAWTPVGDVQVFAQAPGKAGYEHNTTVSLEGMLARYVRLTIDKAWNGKSQAGLSEVRFFHVPLQAFGPQPADGATDVPLDAVLYWRPGREAARHELYFGPDAAAVTGGAVAAITEFGPPLDNSTLPCHQYSLSLLPVEYGRTYYWKVDEINDVADPSLWQGGAWSFTAAEYGVVDDFESYTNDSPNRVFQTWIDGWGFSADDFFPNGHGGNGTGSLIGFDPQFGDIMQKAIVHGGRQSMPFAYDNTSATRSEATRTFDTPQDWTDGAADTFVVHLYGEPAPAGTTAEGVFYVVVEDSAGASAKVSHSDPAIVAAGAWARWDVSLAEFTAGGVDLRHIRKVTLGVGKSDNPMASNTGTLYIDDLWLTRLTP